MSSKKLVDLVATISLLVPTCFTSAQPLPTQELLQLAARYKMPTPPKDASLVFVHTGAKMGLGDDQSLYPAVYSPGFLLEDKQDRVIVMRGAETESLIRKDFREAIYLPFSTTPPQPAAGGYAAEFHRLSAFICGVQLAARGDENTAQQIWQNLKREGHFSDAEPLEDIENELKNPLLFFGRCMYQHLWNKTMDDPARWPEIYQCMRLLSRDFPVLFKDPSPYPKPSNVRLGAPKTQPARKQVLDGLAAALKERPAPPNSTEALLVQWSRIPRDTSIETYRAFEEFYNRARELTLRGADVVPELITLLSDSRITTFHYPGVMNASARSLLLGELAELLLREITGTIPGPTGRSEPSVFHSWLERTRRVGEKEVLAESAFELKDGKISSVRKGPLNILARKYPNSLEPLCRQFSVKANPDTQPFPLAEAIASASLTKAKRIEVLADFAQRGSLAHKRCVLQCLAPLDTQKCCGLLLPLLKTLPPDSSGPYWTCPEAAFTHVVVLVDDTNVWREFLSAAKRSSAALRMEMMNPMNYTYIGQTNRSLRLAFLAAFLEDKTVRDATTDESRFTGPFAGFTFPKISVQDFASSCLAAFLRLPDIALSSWSQYQWEDLRMKVKLRLADEELPEF